VILVQRKGPIIGYYADRYYLDLWGLPLGEAIANLKKADFVVLDRNTEYMPLEDQESFRQAVKQDFSQFGSLPESGSPVLELFRRTRLDTLSR
jgi:hypothetical protein